MEETNEHLIIKWDKLKLNINGKFVDYPMLRVKFLGDPSFVDLMMSMVKIESFTENFKEDYISITDFTELIPNKIIESLISFSSNRVLRSITFVSNQSKMSFVLLGKDSKLTILKKRLEDVNKATEEKDYSYNYRFIEEESQMSALAEEYLNRK